MSERSLVGVLGSRRTAAVDARGTVTPERAGWRLTWWIGADDRWHIARRDAAVRQTRVDDMPVVRTAMRVPGGDAVQQVYGAHDVAVVAIANQSPAPFVVGLVVEGAASLAAEGRVVAVDRRPAIVTTLAPSRWSAGNDGRAQERVTSGQARDGPFAPRTDRGARLVAAFLYPLAHGATMRAAIGLGPEGVDAEQCEPAALPDAAAVARGWRAQLNRGMQVTLPDDALQHRVDAARAALLLDGQAWMPDPMVVAALDRWGFDTEVAAAAPRLARRARRAWRSAAASGGGGAAINARETWEHLRRAPGGRDGAMLLLALRAGLVGDSHDEVALVRLWPAEWEQRPLDVRAAPTARGPVSFSVRWHGSRPALLWEAPEGARVTAPGLDPAWSAAAPSGEALLGTAAEPDNGRRPSAP